MITYNNKEVNRPKISNRSSGVRPTVYINPPKNILNLDTFYQYGYLRSLRLVILYFLYYT